MKKGMLLLVCVLLAGGCATAKVPKEKIGTAKSAEVNNSYVVVDVTLLDGKLTKVSIDETGATSFDGKITGTKKQLGDEYGMRALSDINKEWFEQIKSLEDYIVTHGIDAVKVKDKYAEKDDLKSTVTISIDKYVEVTKQAITNAETKK